MSEQTTTAERNGRFDEIVLAYLKSVDAGNAPDPREVIARHPDLADQLRAFFADQERLAPIVAPLQPTRGQPAAAPASRSFGDYVLLGEIARGGMGVVYKARQVSLNRVVALKMLLPGRLAAPDDVRASEPSRRTSPAWNTPTSSPFTRSASTQDTPTSR